MICDLCKKNEAVMHYTEVRDSQNTEYNLCRECAELKGLAKNRSTDLFVLPGPLNRLARFILEAELPLAKALALPCGTSLAGILRKPMGT